jgi:hypothetical protein
MSRKKRATVKENKVCLPYALGLNVLKLKHGAADMKKKTREPTPHN